MDWSSLFILFNLSPIMHESCLFILFNLSPIMSYALVLFIYLI